MSNTRPKVKFIKLRNHAKTPVYSSEGAAGADLSASVDEDVVLVPGGRALIPTGLRMEIPTGYEGQVRPRSGLAIKSGVTILNTPGTIDEDYRGEIKVILVNLSDQAFTVKNGDRIAQLVIAPVSKAVFEESDVLSDSIRSSSGFGSTGV